MIQEENPYDRYGDVEESSLEAEGERYHAEYVLVCGWGKPAPKTVRASKRRRFADKARAELNRTQLRR